MSTEMVTWADGERLRKLAALLKQMLPNGSKLSDGEALALAQAAVAMGRNPLAGEVYAMPGRGLVDGYRGLQKDARPGTYRTRFRPMTQEEATEHELGAGDIGKVCELYVFAEIALCKQHGIPYEPTIGIGIVRAPERQGPPPAGRSWAWKAEIRALKDALRRAGLAYVDADEVEELRQRAEAIGLDTRGAQTADDIARLAATQAAMIEAQSSMREEIDAAVAEGETREEAARRLVRQAADDLFGEEPSPHWIDRPEVRRAFWKWANDHGMSRDDVHAALGVEHVRDFQGSMQDAKAAMESWIRQHAVVEVSEVPEE